MPPPTPPPPPPPPPPMPPSLPPPQYSKSNDAENLQQHVIAPKSNHINTMLPTEMVLAPLQKLKIKYELSYQSTTRLKYIDKFYQLLIIHQ
jgi:hypothetical protein